ncbi:hypothetical protein D3C80_1168440 [compost metagenome]
MRRSAVPALADDTDQRLVDRGHGRPLDEAQLAGRDARPIMQAKDGIDRKSLEQSIIDHPAGACTHFLGRLEDQRHCTRETAVLCQISGSGEQDSRVAVMAAGMHDAGIAARIGKRRRLLNRQRVDIGANS